MMRLNISIIETNKRSRTFVMMNLKEIEKAIRQLPKNEVQQLVQWLDNYLDDEWDKQMETDLAQGKLDSLIAKAEADITANRVKDIDGVLYNY